MLNKLTAGLDFQAQALVLRSERQRTLASNIANADTPGYAARDFNFAQAMQEATGSSGLGTSLASPRLAASGSGNSGSSSAGFMPIAAVGSAGDGPRMGYVAQAQPSMDGNSVDLDRERAAFADNSVRYEATLRFINGQAKTMLAAIQGQ